MLRADSTAVETGDSIRQHQVLVAADTIAADTAEDTAGDTVGDPALGTVAGTVADIADLSSYFDSGHSLMVAH